MTSPYRWVILALTIVAFMQTHVHRIVFAALLPDFVADVGVSYTAAGTIQTAYFWTYTAAQIPVGVIADRWGPKRVMVVCMALLTVGAVAFAASASYVQSVSARMRELTTTAAGVTNTACFVGAMVLPIALGRAVDVTGSFAASFLLAAAVQAVAFAAALFIGETGPRGAGRADG